MTMLAHENIQAAQLSRKPLVWGELTLVLRCSMPLMAR